MTGTAVSAAEWLADASIDPAVLALRPDYRALLMTVEGITPGAGDEHSEALLRAAETAARQALAGSEVEDLPHVAAWRDAYRSFGAKPQKCRNSLEQLLRRAEAGLPRVARLVDVYNAVSVLSQVPLGGEDLSRYRGAPRLVRATGEEPFDTAAAGETVVEHPEVGEVVWCDDAGVTCRRWNWRQCRRTAITDTTTSALFILDALEPLTDEALLAAADDLAAHLRGFGGDLQVARRVLGATPNSGA